MDSTSTAECIVQEPPKSSNKRKRKNKEDDLSGIAQQCLNEFKRLNDDETEMSSKSGSSDWKYGEMIGLELMKIKDEVVKDVVKLEIQKIFLNEKRGMYNECGVPMSNLPSNPSSTLLVPPQFSHSTPIHSFNNLQPSQSRASQLGWNNYPPNYNQNAFVHGSTYVQGQGVFHPMMHLEALQPTRIPSSTANTTSFSSAIGSALQNVVNGGSGEDIEKQFN
jgi:hypothetical protein